MKSITHTTEKKKEKKRDSTRDERRERKGREGKIGKWKERKERKGNGKGKDGKEKEMGYEDQYKPQVNQSTTNQRFQSINTIQHNTIQSDQIKSIYQLIKSTQSMIVPVYQKQMNQLNHTYSWLREKKNLKKKRVS